MSSKPYYKKGEWNVICDSCGRKFKSSQLRKRWDGLMVCKDDYEPRHPQEFVRAVADVQAPTWTRPEVHDTYTDVCGPGQSSSVAGVAVAGCMIAGKSLPAWYDFVPDSTFTL